MVKSPPELQHDKDRLFLVSQYNVSEGGQSFHISYDVIMKMPAAVKV